MKPVMFLPVLWGAFIAYWIHAARSVKRPRVRQPGIQRFLAYAGMIICAVLLVYPADLQLPVLGLRMWPAGPVAGWAGIVACLAGIAFAIWARRILADNWSAEVQIKEDHVLMTKGPYGIVRHPIYAGLCVALIGTWMTLGTLIGLVAVITAFLGMWHKMALEEEFMRRQFPDAYPPYAARVKRLVPGVF